MRELDDRALERMLRETLHDHADPLPVQVTTERLETEWRGRQRRLAGRRRLVLVGLAAALLVPIGIISQSGGRQGVIVVPSIDPSPSPSDVAFQASAYPGWIAYGTSGAGPAKDLREVRLVRADGSDDHGIQSPASESWDEAEWSPDGSRLLLGRHRLPADRLDILEHDVTTGTSRELVRCDGDCAQTSEASYSPDGLRVAHFHAEGTIDGQGIPADCGLRILTVATGATETLTRSPCGLLEERHPRWSPDGTRLAFYRTRQDVKGGPVTGSAVFVRDVSTGAETQATSWESQAEELDWSPDGQWIAFVDGSPGNATTGQLSRVRPDGTGREVLADFGADGGPHRPRYTSDGRWILVTTKRFGDSAGILLAIPADGGSWTELLDGLPGTPFIYATLQPTR